MVKTNYLPLSWSVSRGRDTHGYNICRLDDNATGQRFKCTGGGYDMVGTAIARWLASVYQERMAEFFKVNQRALVGSYGCYWKHPDFYGAHIDMDSRKVILDGACGIDCMMRIAAAIGVRITSNWNNRKRTTEGYFVTDFVSAEALRAAE